MTTSTSNIGCAGHECHSNVYREDELGLALYDRRRPLGRSGACAGSSQAQEAEGECGGPHSTLAVDGLAFMYRGQGNLLVNAAARDVRSARERHRRGLCHLGARSRERVVLCDAGCQRTRYGPIWWQSGTASSSSRGYTVVDWLIERIVVDRRRYIR
jgi:hypothetical protein